jgi:hypothetical protein
MQAFAGLWGLPVIIAGSCPVGTPPAKAVEDLVSYAKAKKHQLKSDRAVSISFDEAGEICGITYLNDPICDDPEMDELVERLQLQAPRQQSRQNPGKRKKPNPSRGRHPKRKRR